MEPDYKSLYEELSRRIGLLHRVAAGLKGDSPSGESRIERRRLGELLSKIAFGQYVSRDVEGRKTEKPIFSDNNDIDPRFGLTKFIVEATSYEMHSLWGRYHTKLKWEQDPSGCVYQTGELEEHPVCTSFFWAKINGQLVLFYESQSQVVDHAQVERWIEKHCKPPKWNGRTSQCDAMNFHHCLHAIDEMNGEKGNHEILQKRNNNQN